MADISSIKLPNNSTYDIKAKKIYYAECKTESTDIAKVVACDGFVLEKGAIIAIRFTDTGTANPASGNISLNINGTGAKNIVPKGSNTILTHSWNWAFRVNQTWIFVYNGTYFVWLNQDNNATYNPMTLGFGYGTCTTAEATAAKVATLASYALVKNGIISIKFTYAVPANATLNINNRGAKPIYYRGAKISADVIDKGDIATFVYDGANYQLLSIDSNNPSTRIDITSKTVDLNDLTLSSGVCHIRRYIEKTSGGAANISNLPDKLKGQPFVLDVELIRLGAVNTDYITIQTIKGVGDMANEYYRWCQNGAWKDWIKRVFTDTTYADATETTHGLMSTTDKKALDILKTPYGICSTPRATAAKEVTLNNFVLNIGSTIVVKFTDTGTTNPTANLTLNVNNTGAKPIVYNNNGNKEVFSGGSSDRFYNNKTQVFTYDGTYWICMTYNVNNTYTNASLGQGYGICTTALNTLAKTATLNSYALVVGGIVSIKFTYGVPANSTLNINSRGAKNILYRGIKIIDDVIKAGDVITFIYDGAQYQIISIDRLNATNMVYTNNIGSFSSLFNIV